MIPLGPIQAVRQLCSMLRNVKAYLEYFIASVPFYAPITNYIAHIYMLDAKYIPFLWN